jgi:hypothetical protein
MSDLLTGAASKVVQSHGAVAPSAWRIEQVMSAWQSARNRLLADDDVGADESVLAELLGPETEDVTQILHRLLRAAIHNADMAAAADARITEIEMRRERYKRRAEGMRTAAYQVMEALGKKREDLPEMTVTIRGGSQSVFIIDESLVPRQFIKEKVERSYDKAAIKAALLLRREAEAQAAELASRSADPETGEVPAPDLSNAPPEVPGATLSNGAPTLQIKRK